MYKIAAERWDAFFAALANGKTKKHAAELAGISMSQIEKLFRHPETTSGSEHYRRWMAAGVKPDTPRFRVRTDAARAALKDFPLFRRRYFGRVPMPWQQEAADQMVAWLATPVREYAVFNMPPGAGKTTFMRDLVCWLICRDRSLRVMWGSGVVDQAVLNVAQIRDEFTRVVPLKAGALELEQGRAFDAEATLMGDYGRFQPDTRGDTTFWAQSKFSVVQTDGEPRGNKEPSVTAFGFDAVGYLGGRYDLCLWDDVENIKTIRASELVRAAFLEQWGQVAENRVEPGGLFAVVMQRLGATDISRHCLDQTDLDGQPVYKHIVYPAHFDLDCRDEHGPDARPHPDGCLLDPLRLPWSMLQQRAAERTARYRVTYQQEETDPDSILIPRVWIDGGVDAETGEHFGGCWDADRALRQLPGQLGPGWSAVISIDPSGSKFWAIEGWVVHTGRQMRWLVDFVREPLSMDDLLEQEVYSGRFTGVVEDMWQRLFAAGMRVSHVIPEWNVLQKHIFVNSRWDNWKRARNVVIVPHYTTGHNKPDIEIGPDMLRDPFKYGRVRLPGQSRQEVKVFIDEHTNHPFWKTDDTVMADWFVELRYRNLFPDRPRTAVGQRRPSWLVKKNRYAVA